MTERDDLLRRVAGVDPYPSDQPLPSDISDSRPPVAILIQGGDDADRVSPHERARTTRWWRGPAVAVAALVVALLVAIPILLIDGSDDPVANTTTAPASTTAPTTPDEPANAMLVTPEIGATWTLVATVDDWLTEPSLVDGELFAIRRGLDSNAEPNSEGILEGMVVGFGGEDDGSPPDYWRSVDGVAWTRADEGGPPPSTEAAVAGASVSVERVISEGEGGTRVDNVVMATSSGALPRAINLRPFQNDWMPRVMMGDLGWVVFSPALEVGLAGNGSQGPRIGNLGLWYSPDTETWFEVTDRGPLVDTFGDVGPIDVFDEGIVVRDDDILVFAATAEDVGWGIVSQLETEIWRLELSPGEPAEAFDFATQSLCDWFSPADIDAIVTSTYEELGVPLDPRDEMEQREGQNSDCYWAWPVVTLSERHEPVDWAGTTGAQHPALDDSVVVSIHEPGFYGLMTGLDALLRVDGHPEPLWFGHATPESVSGDVETINTLGLSIANKMLKKMGWIE